MKLAIALFQPDIAGNTGTILRLAACFDLEIHIIEPAGFNISDKNLRRAAMDYINLVKLYRHIDWQHFYNYSQEQKRRLILFTTKTKTLYYDFNYKNDDILLFGRESAGVPDYVVQQTDHQITIPMQNNARSLNLAISVAMAVSIAQYKK